MSTLQRAIELAVQAHAGQAEDDGTPYILHPMRVMLSLPAEDALRSVGILHDTVERSGLTYPQLRAEGFSRAVIKGVRLMTHAKVTTYAEYVVALKRDAVARAVKMADLLDNANLRHVDLRPAKYAKDRMRATRYILSYKFLDDELDVATYRRLMKRAEADA